MNRKQTRLAREAQGNLDATRAPASRRATVWETADIQASLVQEGAHAQRVWASCVQAGMAFGTRGAMGQRIRETDKRSVRK